MRLLIALTLCAAMHLMAADRQVAITFDDLPRAIDGGPRTLPEIRVLTQRLLTPFRDGKIPVIGFVNEGNRVEFGPEGMREIVDLWLDFGAGLGNHSYSHLNVNDRPIKQYTADIVKGEPILRAALASRGRKLVYYRHPFLHTGPTPKIKQQMQAFLDTRGYRVASVTIDNADYQYARIYTNPRYHDRVRQEYVPYMESVVAFFEKRSVEVVGREFAQILLVHASQLNADTIPDMLAMFRRRGYRFVSLDEALADDAYRLPDGYVGSKGISWIHRWGVAKGMPIEPEPEPPQWVLDAWAAR